jgi:hypothetical protein
VFSSARRLTGFGGSLIFHQPEKMSSSQLSAYNFFKTAKGATHAISLK